jgi:hypothetical protein
MRRERGVTEKRYGHSVRVAAHRPLGSIMHAPLYAYPLPSAERFAANGVQCIEPVTAADISD